MRWARLGAAIACGVLVAPTVRAIPPAECGTAAGVVARVESLRDEGAHEAGLRAAARIPVAELPAQCRVYVRALEAEMLVALDRLPEARARYAGILDEIPWWRPVSGRERAELRRLFEEVRAEWVRTNAGPLRVAPSDIALLSPATGVASTAQPVLIQAMQQGEISWRVLSADSWIRVSRLAGTTFGGRDTVVVSARTPEGEPAGTRSGQLVFEAPPWPDVTVDVEWEIGRPERVADVADGTSHRSIAIVAIGAAVIGTIVGLIAF